MIQQPSTHHVGLCKDCAQSLPNCLCHEPSSFIVHDFIEHPQPSVDQEASPKNKVHFSQVNPEQTLSLNSRRIPAKKVAYMKGAPFDVKRVELQELNPHTPIDPHLSSTKQSSAPDHESVFDIESPILKKYSQDLGSNPLEDQNKTHFVFESISDKDDVAFSAEALEKSQHAISLAKKIAIQPGAARMRVLSIPDPSKNKPHTPLVATNAREALDLAAQARINPWRVAILPRKMGWKKTLSYSVAFLILSSSIVSQYAWSHKEKLAAQNSLAKTIFTSLCLPLHCTLYPPQLPEFVELEGADVRLDADGHLVFTASLKSIGSYTSSVPSLYLAIEDEHGATISSKIFSPNEWLKTQSIAPGESLDAQMVLTTPPQTAGGFKAQLNWAP